MDFEDSKEEAAFRGEARGWLTANIPTREELSDLNELQREERQLPGDNPALHLIQQIRDEAHRFAIEFQRSLRQKVSLTSVLEEIPGIGPRKRRSLLRELGSLRAMGTTFRNFFRRANTVPYPTIQRPIPRQWRGGTFALTFHFIGVRKD